MKHIIIIRGPAGVGKSTTAKLLKKTLGDSLLFNIDMVCSDLIGGHPRKTINRNAAYDLCLVAAKKNPDYNLIFERLFIDQKDIDTVIKKFSKIKSKKKIKVSIFTLTASLEKLKKQDSKRPRTLGHDDITRLYGYFVKFKVKDSGTVIEVKNKKPTRIVKDIISQISK
jgi:deoxyadenosine/deoxycytidine kinase